ncbi:hypothetical protein EHI8A_058810 [Entamoeba histolytica HM-1:IMSS-B]|uniref:FHA domain-containing protein n=6 Tax=Entamoeba histolytica TaxID=5759 RepID=B1N448_ENTH1|nr:hypothetical protein EHI_037170 [Entamoeba histolytica HM-1:IMSS]EMD47766.1 Hypothetical protein EHI5A_090840 [Entamoeba histolytica KU27]EMH73271.1 hypothetical protein EHI8A_058810 [Entamoeba histolytica HM-1:IMSS-B]EMS17155.1 hypothetical protein KM1_111110 [Entamoeba histolytica HM-3:IMSS]ENY65185.1 hypothetical protein EHI7A_057440 [Entamoeba histolytica HM-1:IMSS-A]GAT97557.1 hypothetical protein CL6EHI_037170 [Entamoeba histolytica]|eukprot:XP_001913965.1 hypothetical protein EHI_037170 [Entamoeba histolytica HM-1:IMSS]
MTAILFTKIKDGKLTSRSFNVKRLSTSFGSEFTDVIIGNTLPHHCDFVMNNKNDDKGFIFNFSDRNDVIVNRCVVPQYAQFELPSNSILQIANSLFFVSINQPDKNSQILIDEYFKFNETSTKQEYIKTENKTTEKESPKQSSVIKSISLDQLNNENKIIENQQPSLEQKEVKNKHKHRRHSYSDDSSEDTEQNSKRKRKHHRSHSRHSKRKHYKKSVSASSDTSSYEDHYKKRKGYKHKRHSISSYDQSSKSLSEDK